MFLNDLGLTWEKRAPLLLRPNSDARWGPRKLAHLYADEYVKLGHITQADFDSYFKFAVVRNPYDRIVSEYLYRFQKTSWWRTPGAVKFLKRTYPNDISDTARHMVPQTRYVQNEAGEVIVDRVLHFETMGDEIEALSEQIFGEHRSLPHINKTKAGKTKDKKVKLRKRMQPLIAEMYAEDFEAFGYDV